MARRAPQDLATNRRFHNDKTGRHARQARMTEPPRAAARIGNIPSRGVNCEDVKMKLKIALSTATAIGLLALTGAAWAGDNNEAYTDQNGNGNNILIQQSAGPGDNTVGLDGAPILQNGDSNSFSERQFTGGGFSRGDNDITAAEQRGNSNVFGSSYSNNAGGNDIDSVLQYGNSNWISIGRDNQREGDIGTIIQGNAGNQPTGGNNNYLTISQVSQVVGGAPFVANSGDGNSIDLVQQIGSNNGSAGPSGPQNPYQWGTRISQAGHGNKISESTVIGSNNSAPGAFFYGSYNDVGSDPGLLANNSNAYRSVQRITQRGDDNGQIASRAVTRGSNGNYIFVDQNGDLNNFDLQQGIDANSTKNQITALQKGNGNAVSNNQVGSNDYFSSVQTGNFNVLDGEQYQDNNTIRASFTGDSNGVGAMSGNAGNLVSTTNGPPSLGGGHLMRNGLITQDGMDNTANLTVTSSLNKFAFLQKGDGNTIDGTVDTDDSNQAAVRQVGNNNNSTFAQSGNGNNLAVSQ
jgi:hypothetical protein